jgi:integrase
MTHTLPSTAFRSENSLNSKAISLKQFFEKWRISVLPQYKRSVQQHLLSDINYHLLPVFGNVLLKNISAESIQMFIASLECGAKTVRNIIGVFRSLWKIAKGWGYVLHDPFIALKLPNLIKPEPRCFTMEEAILIVDNAREPYKTFYWLVAETGMRAGELCGLRWEDVDLNCGIVRVRQSVWNGFIQSPKTAAGNRTFAISLELIERLREVGPDMSGLIFRNQIGRPRKGSKVVEKHLRPLLERLNCPPGGLHAFRHLNGTLMDHFGTPMKVRQERLGHSSAMITLDRYSHSLGQDHRAVAAELGKMFGIRKI